MKILGVDPEFNGAAALLKVEKKEITQCSIFLTPAVNTQATKEELLQGVTKRYKFFKSFTVKFGKPDLVVVERLWIFPKSNVNISTNLITSYGIWLGILAKYPIKLIEPKKWKKHFNVVRKTDSIYLAENLLNKEIEGERRNDIADAILIALAGAKEWCIR